MKNKNLAFIDIETTGFDIERHEIIEIGCVIVKQEDGVCTEIVEEFDIKIQPQHIDQADPEALAINGYNEAAWMFASTKEQAMTMLSQKTKDCIMVAHNIAFDYSFLAKAFAVTKVPDQMFYAKIDTISFAYAKLAAHPEISRYSLGALCEHYGIINERAHTARADARATYELYTKLLQE